jgi:glc operon protein GlcG
MISKKVLNSFDAWEIVNLAKSDAIERKLAVTVVVVDDGGHMLAMSRLDGCAPMATYIATEKARCSALGRKESKFYEDMINGGRTAFLSAPISGFLEGGVPITVDGDVIGAVGVSGVRPEQDAELAHSAIRKFLQ